jgi:hypothetical protein
MRSVLLAAIGISSVRERFVYQAACPSMLNSVSMAATPRHAVGVRGASVRISAERLDADPLNRDARRPICRFVPINSNFISQNS